MAIKKQQKQKNKSKKPKRSLLGLVGRFCLLASIWGSILLGLILLWFVQDLPDLNHLQTNVRTPSITIQTIDGTVINTYGDVFDEMVRVQDLPKHVPQALMAVEDRRFYYHFGVDIIGLARAAYENYRANRVVQGGSTVTQQLAKNLLFTEGSFTVSDRSFKRKILEVFLAVWLEWKFSKDDILTMYLNRVYLGAGTFGIEAAAQRYFNKSARDLTVFEAAVIAGLLKAPSRFSPSSNPEKAKERAKTVLQLMQEAGFIKNAQTYFNEGIHVLENNKQESSFKYFCDWVIELIPNFVNGMDRDLIVVTTLDPAMQRHADRVCVDHINEMGTKLKTSQLALLAMNPDGAVRAMIGGVDYKKSQFNRVQASRQPGSAFKMFIFLAAMEDGMSPEDKIDDSPYVNGTWRPSNFTWKTRGEVSIVEAFSRSVNSVPIRLMEKVTPRKVIEAAHRLGITSPMEEHLSLSLGAIEATLLDLTSAFATYANQGRAVWPYGILEIRDKEGNILYRREEQQTQIIIKPEPLAKMRTLLRAVVDGRSGYRANVSPTVMGKTGTNGDKSGNIDAWFFSLREPLENDIGFQNLVVGVWTGNDKNKRMANESSGSNLPALVTAAFYRGPEVYNGPNQPPKKTVQPKISVKTPTKDEKQPQKKDAVEELLEDFG
ncbi:MAG: PBP1A family penicillin-binding protein [Alphaproteobacteria bacterium]